MIHNAVRIPRSRQSLHKGCCASRPSRDSVPESDVPCDCRGCQPGRWRSPRRALGPAHDNLLAQHLGAEAAIRSGSPRERTRVILQARAAGNAVGKDDEASLFARKAHAGHY